MNAAVPPPLPPKPSWFRRHQIWLVSCLVVLAVALAAAFIGAIAFFVFNLMRSSEPYKMALASAKADPRIVQRLGTPIEEGWFSSGNISYAGSSGHADLSIPVSGPLESATLYVVASRSAGEWTFTTLVCVLKNSGERLDVVPITSAPRIGRAERDIEGN